MKVSILCTLCLLMSLLFAVQAAGASTAAPRTFTESALTVAAYTEGADAAFDGDKSSGYAGSITLQLEKRSVLTGLTVRASAPIVNMKVKGSENGVDWYELYYQKSFATIAIFGSNGSGKIDDNMCEQMYTYSLQYVRLELEYGAIGEIALYGYATDVDGYIAPLDTSFGGCGYTTSGSYYEDFERMPFVVDHIIHSSTKGEVVTYEVTGKDKYAHLTMKAKGTEPLTEIALMHKNDKNITRWDSMLVEASADGKTWVPILQLPADFSAQNNLRQRTVFMVDIPENTNYHYARISSTRGSISICVMDLYTASETSQLPDNLLNAWENNPYKGEKAPVETEETTAATAAITTAAPIDTQAPEKKSGCGSALLGTVSTVLLSCGATLVCAYRRKKK